MIVQPLKGVGDFRFDMPLADALACVAGCRVEILNRGGGDEETEHWVFQNGGGKPDMKLALHEVKWRPGLQAINVFKGPLFLEGGGDLDLMSCSRTTLRSTLPGKLLRDDQGDTFVEFGICPWFEDVGLDQKPSAILVVSPSYLQELLSIGT
ncbi:hypothetical protein ACSBOB_25365 [Mesorhizobium sp. ASY16-5R]|uniref:hypothetical protein n=1 Tax=Mesorhizobium sp. ASY16-5R TaxID=3445772 RepID=UPI003F9EE506